MVECYVGEIRMFAGDYAPEGWAMCNGQLLPINGNDALFSLIGNTYGGDGVSNFAVPDMRGRVPISAGTSKVGKAYVVGQSGGTEKVTLTNSQMPLHTHPVNAQSEPGALAAPTGNFWAETGRNAYQVPGSESLAAMNQRAVSAAGGSQAHENMMPFLTLTFIIALSGIYPSN